VISAMVAGGAQPVQVVLSSWFHKALQTRSENKI